MATCTRCYSDRLASVYAYMEFYGGPINNPIKAEEDEDDISFSFCTKCGQIQGQPFESYYK